jgi:hypothetical protein
MTRRPGAATEAGPSPVLRLLAWILVLAFVAGCTPGMARTTFPPVGFVPPPPGSATDPARREVVGALGELGLLAEDAPRPYRPTEGPLLAWAPRTVVQVTLPDDPDGGFVVIYAFDSPQRARAAAVDHAAYVASSIGRANFSADARFVVRLVDSTVVWYWWSPGGSPDSRTRSIEDALLRVGSGVPVPA